MRGSIRCEASDAAKAGMSMPSAPGAMAVVGALVGSLLPGVAGRDASTRRGRWVGALLGVGMLALGTLVFFLVLSRFDGA